MRDLLLKHALPLVQKHGFTRKTLSLSAMYLPKPHAEPLSDTAITALFGPGDDARKTLIQSWLDEGINKMRQTEGEKLNSGVSIRNALRQRLKWNEPGLEHLPEAFALLSVSRAAKPLPLLDPWPAIFHSVKIADEACIFAGDTSIGTSWYTQRAWVSLVYTATELHQLTSPSTAFDFLDTLLESSYRAGAAISDIGEYSNYIMRSWAGIIKSKGLL